MKLVYSRLYSPCPHPPRFICLLQNAKGLMFPIWKRKEEVLSWLYVLQDSASPCLFPSFSSVSSWVLVFRQVLWLAALGSPPPPAERALLPQRSQQKAGRSALPGCPSAALWDAQSVAQALWEGSCQGFHWWHSCWARVLVQTYLAFARPLFLEIQL